MYTTPLLALLLAFTTLVSAAPAGIAAQEADIAAIHPEPVLVRDAMHPEPVL